MAFRLTAIVTLLMLLTYFWTGIKVGDARRAHGVKAPATEGPDAFNRVYRAHVNTLEQLVLMLPALWIFSITVSDQWAGLLGCVWIVGRVVYVTAYSANAEKRGLGFMIGLAAFAVATLGSLGTLLWALLRG